MGTFAPTRHAVEYWRNRSKAGETNDARVINTTSPSGIYGNVGQTNYGAAKAGIASFTVIAAMELGRYGVTVNAIAPAALTRMTENLGGGSEKAEKKPEEFDPMSPGNIAPLVVWLGSPESAGITGRVFNVQGDHISVAEGWVAGPGAEQRRPLGPGRTRRSSPVWSRRQRRTPTWVAEGVDAMGDELTATGTATSTAAAELPDQAEMLEAIAVIKDHADRLFLWEYGRDRGQLVTLYNKAMGSQWNSVTDLDWSIDVDPEKLVAEQDSPVLALARLAGACLGRHWPSGRKRSTPNWASSSSRPTSASSCMASRGP